MFCIDKRNKITITKGDTATIFVQVFDMDDNEYNILPTDTVTMTVRTSDNTVAFIKEATPEHYIIINPGDTSVLDPGLYVYDIQLTGESGYVYTIIPRNYFQITGEVTHE